MSSYAASPYNFVSGNYSNASALGSFPGYGTGTSASYGPSQSAYSYRAPAPAPSTFSYRAPAPTTFSFRAAPSYQNISNNQISYGQTQTFYPSTQSTAPSASTRSRSLGWNASPLNLAQYKLNQDPNPLIIRKKSAQPVKYTQQVSVKFLQPPPPQQPGDIVITQQKDRQAPAAPPKIIRQRPPPPTKPAPLIIRERPPVPPSPIAPEHHVIPGKVIPPPPRKVITEKYPEMPAPPQDIIVERWLEYPQRSRRVIFHRAPKITPAAPPKNVIIQWESPAVTLSRQIRNLGILNASPNQYITQYGSSLVDSSSIPEAVRNIRPSNGMVLAAESRSKPIKFVGDVEALKYINRGSQNIVTSNSLLPQPSAQIDSYVQASDLSTSTEIVSDNENSYLSDDFASGNSYAQVNYYAEENSNAPENSFALDDAAATAAVASSSYY